MEYLIKEGTSAIPSGCLEWQYGRDTGHLRSFWCQGCGGQMAAWHSVIKHVCSLWCQLIGSHWLGCSWNWPLWPRGSSTLLVSVSPRATDVGLLSIVPPEAGLQVSSMAWDKSLWSSVAILGWVAVVLGYSMADCREEGGIEVLQGAETLGVWSPSVT